eukprot:10421423-Karenia_brevis.AAC.1
MDAQAKLSVCRPRANLEPASCIGGVANFAHLKGDIRFLRQAPLQLFSTMNFILNTQGRSFKGLSERENAD